MTKFSDYIGQNYIIVNISMDGNGVNESALARQSRRKTSHWKLNQLRRDMGIALHDNDVTFDQFATAHYHPYIRSRNGSWERTERILRHGISPYFGHQKLTGTQRSNLCAWMERSIESGLKPSTVDGYRAVLSALFNYAKPEGYSPFGRVIGCPARKENKPCRAV